MKLKWLMIGLIISTLLLFGCQKQEQIIQTETENETELQYFEFTKESFPRVDGSTANIPLGEAVQALLLGMSRQDVEVEFNGTYAAYLNLIYGDKDIVIGYEPPEDIFAAMAEMGVEFEMASIGRDALVFLVNPVNPITSLTDEEIKGIYSGTITNWNQLGDYQGEIKAFQRNDTSGSQTLMKKLVMANDILMEPIADQKITGMGDLVDLISSYDNGKASIGYNVYYYVTKMKEEQVRVLAIDGIEANDETISSGSYPYINDFYVTIRSDAKVGSPERILFEWLQSEDGQALIAHEGYCLIAE